ncbi:MAG: hypothetical protein ACXABY_18150 [Candidatus Thorarchaeota archaeon]|jgi:hypothetical protein
MHEWITAILYAVNIGLILALMYVYICNCRKMTGKYPVGLLTFSVLFLIQSILGLYFAFTVGTHSESDFISMTVMEGIKAVSFAILLWISYE